MNSLFGLLIGALSSNANAACSSSLSAAKSATGSSLIKAFERTVKCDRAVAEENFQIFVKRATDVDTLVALSLSAIENDVWMPLWKMPGMIQDYSTRDVVAKSIGEKCNENVKILPFLQGAYTALKNIDFARWNSAYATCEAPALGEWMATKVSQPPSNEYDDKYATLMDAYIKRTGPSSLSTLQNAAIAAAEGGPFNSIITGMDSAVAPALGDSITEENKASLESAMVEVAKQVTPERAKEVAERLANAGSETVAAGLLTSIYPDRHNNGVFTYGAAAIELADCSGTKTAVLHVTEVSEPGKRWIITDDIEVQLRASKAKLKKCASEGDWGISTTAEPIKNGRELSDWTASLEKIYAEKGYEVSQKGEKNIKLD
ncbi:MAG: hypothetical protein VXZ96_19335 [Myxococcota bacterium]|nr:hypothetical protein [Myxococcota bacterium]